jgi:hypothetical protein
MPILGDIANNIKARVIREVSHAPVGFIAAVATLIDLAARLVGGHETGLPPAIHVPDSSAQTLGLSPKPIALLEFIGFQVVIAFIADWLNERAVRFGASPGIVVGLFVGVLAAYLTAANSFELAYFLIESERASLAAFDEAILTSTVLALGLMTVFLCERNYGRIGAVASVIEVLYRIGPFVFVILCSLTYFVPQFEARLEPLYHAKLDQKNFGK